MSEIRPLSRPRHDRVLAGVLAGIGRRFDMNPNGVRVLYIVASILSAAFPGILVYLLLWLLIPEEGGA